MAKKQNPVATVETSQDEIQVAEVQVEQISQDETPEVVEVATAPTMRVGARAKQLILEGILDNKGILAALQKEYPQGKTSMACIAWYKSDLKKAKAKEIDPDQGYKDWLKANELELRAKYEATLVTE